MALVMEINYTKKLGLPGYSSHQCSITLKTEIADLNQIATESGKLYGLLQACVDRDLQKTGFLPETPHGHSNGHRTTIRPTSNGADHWNCSDKQRLLILKIVEENQLDKRQVDLLAQERFQKPVKALNKLEASGLIDELLERYGEKQKRGYSPLQKARR